jgi:hypothetical protein
MLSHCLAWNLVWELGLQELEWEDVCWLELELEKVWRSEQQGVLVLQ